MLFRRKRDFRPDRTDRGLLFKLYITPLQRQKILKWVLMALLMLVLSLLQDGILSRLSFWGATTDMIPCGIFLVVLLLDPEQGGFFALITATLYYFSGSSPGPYAIAALTILSLMINIIRHAFLQRTFSSVLICAGLGLLIYELMVFLIGFFLGFTTVARLQVFLVTAGISVVGIPLMYPIVLAISKIGGETW